MWEIRLSSLKIEFELGVITASNSSCCVRTVNLVNLLEVLEQPLHVVHRRLTTTLRNWATPIIPNVHLPSVCEHCACTRVVPGTLAERAVHTR